MRTAITTRAITGEVLLIFKRDKQSDALEFIGQVAVALDELGPDKTGFVRFHGEYWKAQSNTTVVPGQKVKITRREGLLLFVEPIN